MWLEIGLCKGNRDDIGNITGKTDSFTFAYKKTDKEKANKYIRKSNIKKTEFHPNSSHAQKLKQFWMKLNSFRVTLSNVFIPFFINLLINKYKCVTFILNQMKFEPDVPRSHGKCTHILITELFDWADQFQITVELTFYNISTFTLNKSSFLLQYSSVVPFLYNTIFKKMGEDIHNLERIARFIK